MPKYGWIQEPMEYAPIAVETIERLSNEGYRVHFSDAVTAIVTTPAAKKYVVIDGQCSCPAGANRRPCKHVAVIEGAIPCGLVPDIFMRFCAGMMLRCEHTSPNGETRYIYQCSTCFRVVEESVVQSVRQKTAVPF